MVFVEYCRLDEIDQPAFQESLDKYGWVIIMKEFSEFIYSAVRVYAHRSNIKPQSAGLSLTSESVSTDRSISSERTKSEPAVVNIPQPSRNDQSTPTDFKASDGAPASSYDNHKEGLIVTRGTYGIAGRMKMKLLGNSQTLSIRGEELHDVTECLQSRVVLGKTTDELIFAGDHDKMCGHDPFPGRAKELSVEYRNHLGSHVLHLLDGNTGRIFGKHATRNVQDMRDANANVGSPLCRQSAMKYGGNSDSVGQHQCPWSMLKAEQWSVQPNFCDLFHGQCRTAHHLLGHIDEAPFKSPAFSVSDRIVLEQTWALFENLKNVAFVGYLSVPTLYMGMMANTRGGSLSAFDTHAKEDSLLIRPDRGDALSKGWLENMKLVGSRNRATVLKLAHDHFTLLWIDATVQVRDLVDYVKGATTSTVVCFHGFRDDLPKALRQYLETSSLVQAIRQWSEYIASDVRVYVHKDNDLYTPPSNPYPVLVPAYVKDRLGKACERVTYKFGRRHVLGGRFGGNECPWRCDWGQV
jgi:hypothetical protein